MFTHKSKRINKCIWQRILYTMLYVILQNSIFDSVWSITELENSLTDAFISFWLNIPWRNVSQIFLKRNSVPEFRLLWKPKKSNKIFCLPITPIIIIIESMMIFKFCINLLDWAFIFDGYDSFMRFCCSWIISLKFSLKYISNFLHNCQYIWKSK